MGCDGTAWGSRQLGAHVARLKVSVDLKRQASFRAGDVCSISGVGLDHHEANA